MNFAKALEASIQETKPGNDAIKAAVAQSEVVPGLKFGEGRTCALLESEGMATFDYADRTSDSTTCVPAARAIRNFCPRRG